MEQPLTRVLGMQDPYNISLYPGTGSADGERGDHILLAPAYTVSDEAIRHIVDVTTQVIRQFFQKHKGLLTAGAMVSGRCARMRS